MPPSSKKEKKPRVIDSDSDDDALLRAPKLEHRIDDQYLNRKVESQVGATRLKQLVTELTIAGKELGKCLEVLTEVAGDVASTLAKHEGEMKDGVIPEDPEQIATLDKEFRTVVDKQTEIEIRTKVLSEMRERSVLRADIRNVEQLYKDQVKAPLDQYRAKTSRQKYAENETYASFRALVWENLYDGAAMPDIKKMIPAEDNDDDDSDDEIEIGAQVTDFKCPLTLSLLKEPMKNPACKHHFSKAAILDMLAHSEKDANGNSVCPTSGCHARFKKEDLVLDKALERRVAAYVERQRGGEGQKKSTQKFVAVSDSEDEVEE
ncbi:E3 SUMO-protein ligase nse2 [Pseudohyphozyma bogoriensis]|nr:E3 SUMO-protein ligase nse2 [Pseudohyphozyma bogoriensis]